MTSDGAQPVLDLLARERALAVAADVDALLALQEDKRRAFELLRAAPETTSEDIEIVASIARKNLELMRHLVHCLAAIALPPAAVYTPTGQRAAAALPTLRRAL